MSDQMAVLAGAMLGACLGFLWFNCNPASVFMGDTGSLALGGLIAYIAIVIRHEFTLVLVGGVFVAEAVSVMIQRYYFKYSRWRFGEGRRVFLMAPIHHHFQRKGWTETQVVVRFWLIGAILAAMAIATVVEVPPTGRLASIARLRRRRDKSRPYMGPRHKSISPCRGNRLAYYLTTREATQCRTIHALRQQAIHLRLSATMRIYPPPPPPPTTSRQAQVGFPLRARSFAAHAGRSAALVRRFALHAGRSAARADVYARAEGVNTPARAECLRAHVRSLRMHAAHIRLAEEMRAD